MVLRGPLLGSRRRRCPDDASLSPKVTDAFRGDGAAQQERAEQTLQELQHLRTHLRELRPQSQVTCQVIGQVISQVVR